MSQKLLLYSDGGARGNPGPAAAAYIALNEAGEIIKTDTRGLGISTNNQAEYEALLMALQFAVTYGAKRVVCYLDSELVVKQLNGEYAVKSPQLQKLWSQVQKLRGEFSDICFQNVRRSNSGIAKADALVNQTLDGQKRPLSFASCDKKSVALLVNVCIRTGNMARSVDFYSRLLGLEIKNPLTIKEFNPKSVFLQDPQRRGCTLELIPSQSQVGCLPMNKPSLFDHLRFEVVDIQKIFVALKKENFPLIYEPAHGKETSIRVFVEDPNGIRIELVEHNSSV
ncbi:MAG: reverse transcriptase-like protein [Nitrososphaerota archaeon]|jgi:ribonuclease HI/catechol 2,3-dioxygenase-like lactoylglutathione lyase family enzyme|nr:reverse transcriptase-like protein [Nitrososphaerota archaeon]